MSFFFGGEGENENRQNSPEQLPHEFSEIDPLFRHKIKRQLTPIPIQTESRLKKSSSKEKEKEKGPAPITHHWYSASITSIGNFFARTLL